MVIPSLLVKGFLVFAGLGVLGTTIAIPTVMLNNSFPQVVIEHFPEKHKADYQEKCQVLVNDLSNQKYLFLCQSDVSLPEFNLYSYKEQGKDPVKVQIAGAKNINKDTVELSLNLLNQQEVSILGKETIHAPSYLWADLVNKGLKDCEFTNVGYDSPWKISCKSTDGGVKKELTSSLLIIK